MLGVFIDGGDTLEQKGAAMKKLVWMVGGLCAAAAGFLVLGSRRLMPVRELDED